MLENKGNLVRVLAWPRSPASGNHLASPLSQGRGQAWLNRRSVPALLWKLFPAPVRIYVWFEAHKFVQVNLEGEFRARAPYHGPHVYIFVTWSFHLLV